MAEAGERERQRARRAAHLRAPLEDPDAQPRLAERHRGGEAVRAGAHDDGVGRGHGFVVAPAARARDRRAGAPRRDGRRGPRERRGRPLRDAGGARGPSWGGLRTDGAREPSYNPRQILLVPRAFVRLRPGAPVPADESDERLMLRFQAGDAPAFEVLVRRHRTPVFSFLVRLTGDRARAEDLCQEVFLKVVKASRTWEERARFRTWVYAIARNLAVDEARRAAFRRAEPLDAPGPAGAAAHPADNPPPDAAAEAALLRPKLEAALAALPPSSARCSCSASMRACASRRSRTSWGLRRTR